MTFDGTRPPAVSVLIPCHNLGRFLDEAVNSVLAQSFQDFEILIIDDGSTDPETRALLDDYRRPRSTVYRTSNQGLAAARNFLVRKSSGRYLCALDADDRLGRDYLLKTVEALDRDASIGFVSTRVRFFGDEDGLWPARERCDLAAMLSDVTVGTASLVRREAVVQAGGYDEQMPVQGDEDWDLWIRLVASGYQGRIIPEAHFYYRRRAGSMSATSSRGDARMASIAYLLRKHHQSYRTHFIEVLLDRETEISALRRENIRLETAIEGRLRPAVDCRRSDLARLKTKLEAARRAVDEVTIRPEDPSGTEAVRELRALREEHQRSTAEVAALRASASWRVTSPLRMVYRWLARPGGSART